MSIDPYTDMARWLDMDARAEAMLRHPAGKGLVSADVQAAMDDEACRLASSNWNPVSFWRQVGNVIGIVAVFVLIVCGPALVADVVAGWSW
ncbi:hypothetical protein [Dietzia sp. ANT_WB102]|uniref:hypothetical protein n=1 Tax=Dietzia sp. ANT_WB102 TaxID=2597345 RepID=UPI0011ED27BD|nr:hypothetical protein [Dietzia sp. ANT_WB102]KAA0916433.1 hypothetical protein FQ137_14510 [Dietzia sp. ANT_WB102]